MRHRSRRGSDVGRARRCGARTSARRTGGLWAGGRAAGARGSAGLSCAPWASGRATRLVVGELESSTKDYGFPQLVCELDHKAIFLLVPRLQPHSGAVIVEY
jgi:hypothetical protein